MAKKNRHLNRGGECLLKPPFGNTDPLESPRDICLRSSRLHKFVKSPKLSPKPTGKIWGKRPFGWELLWTNQTPFLEGSHFFASNSRGEPEKVIPKASPKIQGVRKMKTRFTLLPARKPTQSQHRTWGPQTIDVPWVSLSTHPTTVPFSGCSSS